VRCTVSLPFIEADSRWPRGEECSADTDQVIANAP
jgi:hypothetical protein